jgi:hypothetical protein
MKTVMFACSQCGSLADGGAIFNLWTPIRTRLEGAGGGRDGDVGTDGQVSEGLLLALDPLLDAAPQSGHDPIAPSAA